MACQRGLHDEFILIDQSQLRQLQRELYACHEQPLTRFPLQLLNGLGLLADHVFIAGATGAGKGSPLWSPLRAIGPMISVGLIRVSMIDLMGAGLPEHLRGDGQAGEGASA